MIRALRSCLLCLPLLACGPDRENVADRVGAAAAPRAEAAAGRPAPSDAPADFQQRIQEIGRGFDGEIGVAVMDLRENWLASHRGDEVFPQQSVSKIWLAVAVLDRVDRGELSLDETVLIQPGDLSVFHQPVKARVLDDGRHVTTVADLISLTIAKSDNATTDILMRRLGGPQAVQEVLEAKGLKGLTAGEEQRVLQPRVAGLSWRPEYANLGLFNQARDAVPESRRNELIEDYLRAPPDGATPNGTAKGLAALKDGRLLSPASTRLLLDVMSSSNTGPRRLRGGLAEGWSVAHKTGTGPTRDGYAVGYNDVGLLTAPDGRTYAVAVYIRRTGAGLGERQRVIAEVSRAVVENWEARHAPTAKQVAGAPQPSTPPEPPA